MDRVSTMRSACATASGLGFNPSFGMDRVSTGLMESNALGIEVSIPRSGWIVFQRQVANERVLLANVSIPRSGWIVFQPRAAAQQGNWQAFQSLVRDGSCFNAFGVRDRFA